VVLKFGVWNVRVERFTLFCRPHSLLTDTVALWPNTNLARKLRLQLSSIVVKDERLGVRWMRRVPNGGRVSKSKPLLSANPSHCCQ
jgi:hypothetical protein